MENMQCVAYYRVSTKKQEDSGLGREAQIAAVQRYIAANRDRRLVAEFEETESGKRADRPKLHLALAECRVRKARLVIAKLDRLARNVLFIAQLMESKVDFHACDLPEASPLTIHIMAAMAEHEAKLISERTKAALAVKRKELAKVGKKLGGNPENLRKSRRGVKLSIAVRQAKARQKREDLADIVGPMREGKATLQTIADALNKQGIEAPRGKSSKWYPASVARLLA